MDNKNYCIVVPVYKEQLSDTEQISLKSLYRETNGYKHTYLVCPEGINIDEYKKIYPNIHKIEFNEIFFKNIYTYSQLCLSYMFYNQFSIYDYMLIYQLDAYLFKDDIQNWVNLDMDYIGAPIFSELSGWPHLKKTKTAQVGNGGISLRKIRTFRYLTDPNSKFRLVNTLFQEELSKVIYEDVYFCQIVNHIYGFDLKIPEPSKALEFAWDQSLEHIKKLLENANVKLTPMGCHGWQKSKESLLFWKELIPEITDELILKCFS